MFERSIRDNILIDLQTELFEFCEETNFLNRLTIQFAKVILRIPQNTSPQINFLRGGVSNRIVNVKWVARFIIILLSAKNRWSVEKRCKIQKQYRLNRTLILLNKLVIDGHIVIFLLFSSPALNNNHLFRCCIFYGNLRNNCETQFGHWR